MDWVTFLCNSEIGCYPQIYGRILMVIRYSSAYDLYCDVRKYTKKYRSISWIVDIDLNSIHIKTQLNSCGSTSIVTFIVEGFCCSN